ncbi:hypothetical protein KFK09_017018 [Dendrobium nobile]|uniref:Uncharacterized protein n=1 Tax=Dendrobium nobile TaxID=94219 RepID=A0A8T3B296_DENNO|nr:hypothetical protein KFK09_017018 [Dendrobium nobile]
MPPAPSTMQLLSPFMLATYVMVVMPPLKRIEFLNFFDEASVDNLWASRFVALCFSLLWSIWHCF